MLQTKIENLDLSVRSKNALVFAGINTLEDLILSNYIQLTRIPSLGKKSINEIQHCIEVLGLSLGTDPESIQIIKTGEKKEEKFKKETAALNYLAARNRILGTLCLDQIDASDVRFTFHLGSQFRVLSNADEGNNNIAECLLTVLDSGVSPAEVDNFLDLFDDGINSFLSSDLTDQLSYVLDFHNPTRRQKLCFSHRFGFAGNDPLTLEAASELFVFKKVTRERVRQVESKFLKWLAHQICNEDYPYFLPKLTSALTLLQARVPIPVGEIPNTLKQAKLCDGMTYKGLKRTCEIFNYPFDFKIVSRRKHTHIPTARKHISLCVSSDSEANQIIDIATSITRLFGFFHIDDVLEYLDQKKNLQYERNKLMRIFTSDIFSPTEDGWFYRHTISKRRFDNTVRKMLFCCPSIEVSEIREGFKRVVRRRRIGIAHEWDWPIAPTKTMQIYFEQNQNYQAGYMNLIKRQEKEIRDIVVDEAGMTKEKFLTSFVSRESDVTWIEKYIRAKRKYSSTLNRNKQKILAAQNRLGKLEKSSCMTIQEIKNFNQKVGVNNHVSSFSPIELENISGGYGNECLEVLKAIIDQQPNGVIEREAFRKLAKERGINVSTFEVELTYGPWLKQFAHSIWGIRGTKPRKIDILALSYEKRSSGHQAATLSHGIDSENNEFIIVRVKNTVNHVVSIPVALQGKVTSQEYTMRDTAGRGYGGLYKATSGSQYVGVPKAFTRMHVEDMDLIKFTFHESSREVVIEILPDAIFPE